MSLVLMEDWVKRRGRSKRVPWGERMRRRLVIGCMRGERDRTLGAFGKRSN